MAVARTVEYGRKRLEQLQQDRPLVVVLCGGFATGKSSLINALLGCDLPTGVNPVTKVITTLRYGESQRIILENHVSHQQWEVSFEAASRLITDQLADSGQEDMDIYFEMPSPFLKKGVVLVDTPGFGDDREKKLDKLTRQEIHQADFCIVTFNCTKFGTYDERDFLGEVNELTNGNFISILNCMNYLQQEEQVIDLEKRAEQILQEYGNQRVGKGRYFMVDSRKGEVELNGFDAWLERLIETEAEAIKKDTPLNMALVEIRKVSGESDRCIRKVWERINELRQLNDKNIREVRQKSRSTLDSMKQALRNELSRTNQRLTLDCIDELRRNIRSCGVTGFSERAKSFVSDVFVREGDEVDERIREKYPQAEQERLGDSFRRSVYYFKVPEPSFHIVERGLLDPDRWRFGKSYRVYNNYVDAAVEAVKARLLPKLKAIAEEYFNNIIKNLGEQQPAEITGGYESEIEEFSAYADLFSEKLLDLIAVQHDIRVMKEELGTSEWPMLHHAENI